MPKKLHPVDRYIRGVLGGKVLACQWVKLACQRQLNDLKHGQKRGLYFDEVKAQHAIDFYQFLRHSKGEWANQVIQLEPWQQFIKWVVFGWYRIDGTRRFNVVYEEVPRKNGKSTDLAGVGLYLFLADGEEGAEVYSAATKRDQARIIHSEAVRMVRKSPHLRKRVTIVKDNLSFQKTNSKFEPLGKDSDSLDGLNTYGGLIDELHAHKKRDVYDIIETSMGSRRSPLLYAITTAGTDQESVCYEQHTYAKQVLSGTIEDDAFFGFISTIDEGDDWKDPKNWKKANPNFGVSVLPNYLESKCHAAMQLPAKQNAFLRLHLNVWTQQRNRWLSLDLWDANAGCVNEAELIGTPCYAALDLSSVSDMTANVMIFPQDNGKIKVLPRFWVPEAKLIDPQNRYRAQYETWHRQGYLRTTPGDSLDYETIEAQVLEDAERFPLRQCNIDILFQGHQMEQRLREQHGLNMVAIRTGMITMSFPTKELERLLLSKMVEHGGNPILRWMADNVAIKEDQHKNMMPSKGSSQGKIDGIMALIMAILAWAKAEQEGRSKYEDHDLLTIG